MKATAKTFKAFKTVMKSNSGFSLIELMVVVGIIGILSAVAVPQYSKFQNKAKQTEAKMNLGGIYRVEKAFYAEAVQYHACLSQIGFSIDGARKYAIGFKGGPTAITGVANTSATGCAANTDGATYFKAGSQDMEAVGTSSNTDFTAFAEGSLPNKDQWSINKDQTVTNTVNGT